LNTAIPVSQLILSGQTSA